MSEHQTQVAFVQWCAAKKNKYPMLEFSYAIPNASKRTPAMASWMKAEGMRKGVLDWCLPFPCAGFHGMYIEFKHGKNKLTAEQDEFMNYVRRIGYYVAVCYTVDEAIAAVELYLEADV